MTRGSEGARSFCAPESPSEATSAERGSCLGLGMAGREPVSEQPLIRGATSESPASEADLAGPERRIGKIADAPGSLFCRCVLKLGSNQARPTGVKVKE